MHSTEDDACTDRNMDTDMDRNRSEDMRHDRNDEQGGAHFGGHRGPGAHMARFAMGFGGPGRGPRGDGPRPLARSSGGCT